MATINLISLNVRRFHASGKRHTLYRELKRMQGDIVFLQETHLAHNTLVKLYTHTITLHGIIAFQISRRQKVWPLDSGREPPLLGRTLLWILLVDFYSSGAAWVTCRALLANFYAPNQNRVSFLASTDFAHGLF